MSNPLAVAAVTATLAQLMGRVIEDPTLSGAGVSIGPPDAVVRTSKDRQINLFLYGVGPNPAWRNADLPFRNGDGRGVGQPVLALDLHYLVTGYGHGDDELDAQHLLAHAMSLIQDNAVLTPDQIRAAQAAEPAIALSDLADQRDLVRLTPLPLSMEDLSKLWGMFPSTNYRLSVAFQASVVLVERRRPAVVAPPPRRATLTVLPFQAPSVDAVVPQVLAPGGRLAILGRHLRADTVEVDFGPHIAVPDVVTEGRVEAALPAGLLAGVNTVQVRQQLDMGTPPVPHPGFASNIVAFVLAPGVTTPDPVTVARGGVLTLAFVPPAARTQRVSALVGGTELVAVIPAGTGLVSSAGFRVPADTPIGDHLLRLRVDGAESALRVDDAPASPTFGHYVGPVVTVTA